MTNMNFNPDKPVVIGLCGKAGSGKTSVADRLAPPAMFVDKKAGVVWDHVYFAIPLYELASIRRQIQGEHRNDRVLYETHRVLVELFGGSPLYGAPPYSELVEFVHKIAAVDIPYDENIKPRTYMQTVGTLCRSIQLNCFVSNVDRMITKNFLRYSQYEETEDLIYACVVSDVRQENEAEWVSRQPNGILIRFDASPEVRNERIFNRDGVYMTQEQLNHETENIDTINPDLINTILDTDDLTLDEQVQLTKEAVFNQLGLDIYAQ